MAARAPPHHPKESGGVDLHGLHYIWAGNYRLHSRPKLALNRWTTPTLT
jgi:hypothetical protein